MLTSNARGAVSLGELIVALTLAGVVAGAVGRTIVTSQRLHRAQLERLSFRANLRSALWLIESELQELSAGDPAGSDLIQMEPTSMRYNAMRNMYFICMVADAARGEVTVGASSWAGLRELDQNRDSVLLFADSVWHHANVDAITGATCADGADGLRLEVSGVSAAELSGVVSGGPLRGVQPAALRLYRDRTGDHWLGMSEWNKERGWSVIQPVAGPLAPDGLRFSYHDASDQVTTNPGDVVRIGVRLMSVGASGQRDSLVTEIALRNNPRW